MKYVPSFGVEIHCELLTNTKAFSPAKVDFTTPPNINVHPTDLGFPGSKPTVNKKVVEHAYRLAKALNMEIDTELRFDRKNYFYPDLAKGFQITQFFKPIGKNGLLKTFDKDGNVNNVDITEIHIEEDTAKQIKQEDGSIGFDFNRAGVGLIEIVSGHKNLNSIDDVINYVEQMRQVVVFLGISDGKMQEGSFRVDVNVSLRKTKEDEYGNRVEIKNLNSFNFIRKALEYEIDLQEKTIDANETVIETTKRYDEKSNQTQVMRAKATGTEYNFFPETNINPIQLTDEVIAEFESIKTINPTTIREELKDTLTYDQLNLLLNDKNLYEYFDSLRTLNQATKESFNFVSQVLQNVLNDLNLSIKDLKLTPQHSNEIINLLAENKLTKTEALDLIKLSFENLSSFETKLVDSKNKEQMSEADVEALIKTIISENPQLETEERPERKFRFMMGELMKRTQGKINMKIASEIVNKIFNL